MGLIHSLSWQGLLSLALVGCLSGQSLAQTAATAPAVIPGTRVRLVPPPDFSPATDFTGYGQEAQGASIVVAELPAPYAELTAALTNTAELAQRGMTLLQQESVTVNGQTGLLLQVQQRKSGLDFLKWILILGTQQDSVIITATLPKDLADRLSEPLKQSLLTTQWDVNQPIAFTAGLNFTVKESGDLKLARRLTNALMFTKGGVFPPANLDDPLFVVAPALGKTAIANPEEFARQRVQATEGVTAIQVESLKPIKIDDLKGYEILAQGSDREAQTPVTVYQVILFDTETYYLMQGLVGVQEGQGYVPIFQAIAQSFQRLRSK